MDLSEMGTDDLHAELNRAVWVLPEAHPVRLLWERLNQVLEDGGSECLPYPWDHGGGES